MVALMMTAEDLKREALLHVRQAAARFAAELNYAAGMAGCDKLEEFFEDWAEDTVNRVHDDVDPELADIQRREADEDPTAFIREQAAMCRWHHGRLGL
jgi:hypothetical protein